MIKFNLPICKNYSLEYDTKSIKEDDPLFYKFIGTLSTIGDVDRSGDSFIAGAFDSWIEQTKQMPMLYQHSPEYTLGHWKNFRMVGKKLRADGFMLKNLTHSSDVKSLLDSGSIEGVSIGFSPKKCEINEKRLKDHVLPLDFHEVELLEASIVSVPANRGAHVHNQKYESLGEEARRILYFELLKAGLQQGESTI